MSKGRKIQGYNVYHAPDGCCESYIGFARTLREARRMAARGNELPQSLYETARAAGHVYGMTAPDKQGEADSPTAWFGKGGWYCAVAVFAGD